MSRITKIEGEFMGVRFEVKPTPINFSKIEDKAREMLRNWYKENHPETFEKIDKEDVSLDDFDGKDLENINAWVEDVEFRSEYLQYKAESCMKFTKPIQEELWKSDDLEISTIEEAWDFFMNRRRVPSGGAQAL